MKKEKSNKDSRVEKPADHSQLESNELFRRIFEDGPLGVALVDPNKKFFSVNSRFCAMLDYTEQELCGMTVMDVTHSDSLEKDSVGIVKLMKGEIPFYKTDKQYIKKNGEVLWASLTVTAVRDSDGKHLYQIGMVEDINERKKTEIELKEAVKKALDEKTKTAAILDAIGDAVSIQDTNFKIMYQNQRHIDQIGFHIGEYCFKAYEGRDNICEGCPVNMSFQDGRIHKANRKSHNDIYVEITSSVLRDNTGNIIAGIEIARDITEQKEKEELIRSLAKFPDENPSPILRATKDGKIIYSNRGSNSLLNNWGCKVGQFLPDYWSQFVQDVSSSGSIQRAELRYANTILSLTFAPVTDSDYVNIYGLDDTDRIHAMEGLKTRSHDLLERIKELDCLYNILKLQVKKQKIPIDEILQKIVELIPPSWQYPEIICGRIVLNGQTFNTDNFRETPWKQSSDIFVNGKREGVLEVCYLDERPEMDEGQFFKEERNLIKAVAEMTGKIIEQERTEKELKQHREHLEELVLERAEELSESNVKLRREINERKRADEALRESEEKYRALFEQAPDSILLIDADTGKIIGFNDKAYENLGYTPEEFRELKVSDIEVAESEEAVKEHMKKLIKERSRTFEAKHRRKDGQIRNILVSARAVSFGGKDYIQSIWTDITERKKLEEQLLHSQKMESIGTLAGGVAHDFNNILTAIIGFANVLESDMPEDDPSRLYVEQIQAAADTAANLTSSLLTFSRKQKINPTLVELNSIVRRMEKLLFRIIGEDIEFRTEITDERLYALVDFSQMQQVIMNLAINARDAMPEGGILTVSTESAVIDYEFIRSHGYGNPGEYAIISVSDTGSGIDENTKGKIFEPFFTSKEVNKGTGLGLSIVYGIVKQHNGYIDVKSAPGKGTTFRIYLPHVKKSEEVEEILFESPVPVSGTETILLAEDDAAIRQLLTSVLTGKGYGVIVAEDGVDALNKFRENIESIDFVLLDVIMPGKRGTDLFKEIKEERPDMKALFISGYSEELMHDNHVLEKGLNIISKPLKPDYLLRKIREILDAELR